MASAIQKQYTRLLRLWPTDPLRPGLPFTRAIQARALPYGVSPTQTPSTQSPTPQPQPTPPATATPPNPALETPQLTALFSLLENRYAKRYPLGDAVFKPRSNPAHYTQLMAEIERAPSKTWWSAKMDQWKMMVRWK